MGIASAPSARKGNAQLHVVEFATELNAAHQGGVVARSLDALHAWAKRVPGLWAATKTAAVHAVFFPKGFTMKPFC